MARPAPLALLSVALFSALAGCAVNPATGKRQLMLVSESQEIALGRESDRAVSAEMGLYEDEALQTYVQELGRRLTVRSERADLAWSFRVVDDPVVNAFALPGGFIYVTRGILAHMNSEAELASVVGHEIGHVTARHGASQMSKAQLAQAGLAGVAIAAPEQAQRFGQMLGTGLGLLFLRFGRDDERQADDLGMRYMISAGYDPQAMVDMFSMLDRESEASGGRGVPTWMSTHPAPEDRGTWARRKIKGLGTDLSSFTVNRDEFLAKIDHIAYGSDPRQGYFKDNHFYHPAMKLRLDFPAGWKLRNETRAVVGTSSEGDAVIELTLARESGPEAALERFFSETGARRMGPAVGSISGLPAAGDGFVAETPQGNVQGRIVFVAYEDRLFRLLGYAPQHRFSAYEAAMRKAIASFDRLTDARALAVAPARLAIVRPERPTTLDELAKLHHATASLAALALLNRVETGARLEGGQPYKLVVGGELP